MEATVNGTAVNIQLMLIIEDVSQIADARRQSAELARSAGFGETDRGRVSLVATEAASNILKHAGHGELLVRWLETSNITGIEIIALDRGPGLLDSMRSFEDGHSTVGTAGTGLGALSRMADEFDWYSQPGKGTVFRMALWPGRAVPAKQIEVGAICVAMPGQDVPGDDWRLAQLDGGCTLMVADGLGHGLEAFSASRAATDLLDRRENWSTRTLLEEAHGALRSTRGAAISVATLDFFTGRLQFAGIGNVAGSIRNGSLRKQFITHNGIVGHNMRRLQELDSELPEEALLILHSDGLSTQWTLDEFPGIEARHPAVIAATIYKEHWRRRDDVTIVALRRA